jgi:lipoate-protein ligase A
MIDPDRCRLLRHDPASGPWNMAVDEMLLQRAQDQAVPCLRTYRWRQPTLSLGYFQAFAARSEHPPSLTCAAVRRLTGGGAILHDAELTYSIVLPRSHPLAARRDELYKSVHGCLIEVLRQLGVTARFCEPADKIATAREPFLCFQRKSPGDVLIGQTKVCGSAQRRRKGAVLQHGSLLWQASPAAPELPGVADIVTLPIGVDMETTADLWFRDLGRRLGFAWQPDDLDQEEVTRATALVESRYACDYWTKNRGLLALRSQESL